MNTVFKLFKLYFALVSRVFPKWAATQAINLFQKPRNRKLKQREEVFYTSHQPAQYKDNTGFFDVYCLGDNVKEWVVLVHGWESNAGSMWGMGQALLKAGFGVILFDLPAHGVSKEKKSNIKACADRILNVLEQVVGDKPFSLVAHSFGSLATSFALSDTNWKPRKLFYLTTPRDSRSIFDEYKNFIGLSEAGYAELNRQSEEIIGESIDAMVQSERLKDFGYEQLILLHDKFDKVLSFSNSEVVYNSIENSVLIPFEKVGHYRMLWNEKVIDAVVNHLATH